jgi:hypothetical protein
MTTIENKGKKIQVPSGKVATETWELIKGVWSKEIITPTTGAHWVMPIDLKIGRRWSDFG